METGKCKKVFKFLFLILLICGMSAMFTGCGFASGDNVNPYCQQDDASSIKSTKVTCNGEEMDGILAVKVVEINPTSPAANFNPGGFKLLRDIAVIMHNSVFGGAADYGVFCSSMNHDGMNLDPANVVGSVNDIDTTGAMAEIGGMVNGMAVSVLIAVWSMGFLDQVVNEKFTMETLLKTFMQLMMGIALINAVPGIMEALRGAGGAIAIDGLDLESTFGSVSSASSDALNANITAYSFALNGLGIHKAIGVIYLDLQPLWSIVILIFPIVTMISCAFKIVSTMLIRSIELGLRITFAPVVIAFSAQRGFSQEAIRYFRGVFACAMQPALIVAGAMCLGVIASAISGVVGVGAGGLAGSIGMGMAFMVLSAFIGETKHLAQEIIGRG